MYNKAWIRRSDMANPNRKTVFVECPDCGLGMAPMWTWAKRPDEHFVTQEYHPERIFSWVCGCNQACSKYHQKAIQDAQHVTALEF